ncbi:hypothetical protein Tco_0431270 [Tanacetum coccineum]
MAAFKVLETQFQMFIKSRIYLDDEYVVMTRNYFLQYTQLEIPEFGYTIDHMDSVLRKSIDEREHHKRDLVDTENSGTESKEQDTSSRSGNDSHADDADNRTIYDEELMAELYGGGGIPFQLKSDLLPHAHAQTTKTYYNHQDLRIKKAQDSKTKTFANSDIKDRKYPKDSGFELTAFLDADHAGCIDTCKSTSGGIQFLGDKLVSWMSKKQDCTAMSSAEAKYVALSASCAQVMWMRTQLKDYGFNYNRIPLYCDSQSAIAISCNPVQHSRTKHIHTRYHFIKEQVENSIIELYFVRTEYQLADMFTKPYPKIGFSILSYTLSWKPCQGDPLNLPDHRIHKDGDGEKPYVQHEVGFNKQHAHGTH